MAGVIYLIGVTKQVEEIIFLEARGVTPHIDTKQEKKVFFPKSCFTIWNNIYPHHTPRSGRNKTNQEMCNTKAIYERGFFGAKVPQ